MSKKVKTGQPDRTAASRSLISPTQAIEAAQNLVNELNLADLPQGSLLANPKFKPQAALPLRDAADAAEGSSSYIVTYAIENDRDQSGTPLVRICIVLDGTDGSFEEITTFARPVTYLSADDAITVVLSALQLPTGKAKDGTATLIFQPCEISHVRAYPFWEVVLDGHRYYVDQRRKLYHELSPGKGGS
jgi:hypothetical protein